MSDHDLTAILRRVESGDQHASTLLWERCFPPLLRYCRRKLPDHLRRVLDEEDVALSAFKSFCLGAQRGAFGAIPGRDELWKLLYCIAGRKADGYLRHQTRLKRGGGNPGGEATDSLSDQSFADLGQSPASMAAFVDECENLFKMLDDDKLQTIAILRIEGYSVDEIADRAGCSKRTVERRLNLIRELWKSLDREGPEQPRST